MAKKNYNKDLLNKDSSVFFATFAPYADNKRLPTNGMVEPLMSFLLPRIKRFLIIIQPHPGSDRINPIIEIYEKNVLKKEYEISSILYYPLYIICKFRNTDKTHFSFKIRDLLSVIIVGFLQKQTFNFFIGLECVNTFGGIILRKLGKVEKVIYYVSDYSPIRFNNSLINSFYLWLDRFCAVYADYIWDVSPAMHPARIKAGLNPKKSAPNLLVPNALFPSQISSMPILKRIPYSLVYMGTLGYENGPDLAIESMIDIRKKYPKAKLHIIGGGNNNLERLKKLAKKLNLTENIIFYGFVVDNNEMAKIVRKCYVALAPYRAVERSVRWYADATKIRQYLASGLPVITTHVPPLGTQTAAAGAGILIKDNKEDLFQAVDKIFSDSLFYSKLQKKAVELSRDNTWDNVFKKAFSQLE